MRLPGIFSLHQTAWVVALLTAISAPLHGGEAEKPMVIVTQDGEVDDRSSFMRFLLYTADMDVRGVIATNSKWQKNGHGLDWIHEAYNRYEQVRDNLLLHKPGYPTVEYLKSVTVRGNEDPAHLTGGAPYVDSEGSALIVAELLRLQTGRLLHLTCWGGANTVAQALWRFQRDHPEAFVRNIPFVRVVCIDFQDEAGNWIVQHLPEVRVIRCNAFHMTWNYHSPEKPLRHNPHPDLMSARWLRENIKADHGPLGAWYPQGNVSEGDTPAFLSFIDNGLEASADYASGGWGGRYHSIAGSYWADASDDDDVHKALWRWIPAVQNDFAARADWCVRAVDEANHPPVILEVTASRPVPPGATVELKAAASDPDGDAVHYRWWHYREPSGMAEVLPIAHDTASSAAFVVPDDGTKVVHVILEVTDDGQPCLKRYARLIFQVEDPADATR